MSRSVSVYHHLSVRRLSLTIVTNTPSLKPSQVRFSYLRDSASTQHYTRQQSGYNYKTPGSNSPSLSRKTRFPNLVSVGWCRPASSSKRLRARRCRPAPRLLPSADVTERVAAANTAPLPPPRVLTPGRTHPVRRPNMAGSATPGLGF